MNWKLKSRREKQFKELKKHGIAEIFCQLLSNRDFENIKNKNDINSLIKSPLSDLEDPIVLQDIEKIEDIISNCKNQKCLIFGDYDADGILSSYMCQKLLYEFGASNINIYLPSRTEDGYGMNDKSVENFISTYDEDYYLIVILDCGSSSYKQIEKLKQKYSKTKIIVIDHHIIDQENFSSNSDVILNYRINNSNAYCTGGLMYQVVRQCAKKHNINILQYLPYAAITTITDVCHMTGANRIIVKNGLSMLSSCADYGLKSLLKYSSNNKKTYNTEDIGYSVGPMINASGRISIATIALNLFEQTSSKKADVIAEQLKNMNEERKILQKKIFDEALSLFEKNRGNKNSALLYDKSWNPSVVGIVASKIAEKYNIPTLCFGNLNGIIKGSARSINGMNIKEIMDSCNYIFEQYGGHEMAAGATLKNEYQEDAWNIFDSMVEKYKKQNKINDPFIAYDYEFDNNLLLKINNSFCERISALEPFGQGNETPIFKCSGIKCLSTNEWKNGNGGFVTLSNIDLKSFTIMQNVSCLENKTIDILFSFNRSFINEKDWMLKIIDYKVI